MNLFNVIHPHLQFVWSALFFTLFMLGFSLMHAIYQARKQKRLLVQILHRESTDRDTDRESTG